MRVSIYAVLILLPPWAIAQQSSFLPSEQCQLCHRLVPGINSAAEQLGTPIGHFPAWRSSMMAHASRDPYWRAKVETESAQHPHSPVSIDAICMRCHAPMQTVTAEHTGSRVTVGSIDKLGQDGVACLVCHQILPDRLGQRSSFTGQPAYSPKKVAAGPHPSPFAMPMLHHTGYTPVEGRHIGDSALCATCHTVITPTLDPRGNVVGEFLEQGPYLEWLASGMPAERSCQSCHVPMAREEGNPGGGFYIAHNPMGRPFPPTAPRTPFGVHSFAGGNAAMLGYLKEHGSATAGLDESAGRTRQNLRRAASLHIETVRKEESLSLLVTIRNHTGHKLPTGFPSRRMWLHLTVKDEFDKVLFESGSYDPHSNEIVTADGSVNMGRQPHRDVIVSQDQVALYETELADSSGKQTHSLLSAARFGKDNRLLPRGFDLNRGLPKEIPKAWLAPAGVLDDANFQNGADTVRFEMPQAVATRARSVHVELLFQSIKPSQLKALHGKAGTDNDAAIARLSGATAVVAIAATKASLGY